MRRRSERPWLVNPVLVVDFPVSDCIYISRISIYIYIYVCVCNYIYIYMCVCNYIYIYIYFLTYSTYHSIIYTHGDGCQHMDHTHIAGLKFLTNYGQLWPSVIQPTCFGWQKVSGKSSHPCQHTLRAEHHVSKHPSLALGGFWHSMRTLDLQHNIKRIMEGFE